MRNKDLTFNVKKNYAFPVNISLPISAFPMCLHCVATNLYLCAYQEHNQIK